MRDAWPLLLALGAGGWLLCEEYMHQWRRQMTRHYQLGTLGLREPTKRKELDQG